MEALSDGDPEGVATVIRLGLSHLAMTAKRLSNAMVLDRLERSWHQCSPLPEPRSGVRAKLLRRS